MTRIIFALFLIAGFTLTVAAHAKGDIEIVAQFDASTPPGNIAIGPDNRIFLSLHGFFSPDLRVVELLDDGTVKPYPNAAWASAPTGDGPGLYGVLGINVDPEGILWMLDGMGENHAGRLVGWDTKTERLYRIIYLAAPVTRLDSFLNDLAIDRKNEAIYIADTATPGTAAIIVVDLNTGRARRVLEGAKVTQAEDIDIVIDDRLMKFGENPARIGVNPITIDPDNEWVYFGPMSGQSIYRVKTQDLLNEDLSAEQLESRVERYGDKPISDGITVDGGGNVYITSITDDSIGVVRPGGRYETLYQRDDLSWPDGFAYGPDHKIYVTINELHRSPVLNDGENGSQGEFKVMRFDALEPGMHGR